jgi:hypothetical protein
MSQSFLRERGAPLAARRPFAYYPPTPKVKEPKP